MIVLAVSYYAPIHTNSKIEVFNEDGQSSNLQLNLILHRYLLRPTVIQGQIEFNGTKYVDWVTSDYVGIWREFIKKTKGYFNTSVFANASNFGRGTAILLSDLLYINDIKFGYHYSVESISILLTANDSMLWNSK